MGASKNQGPQGGLQIVELLLEGHSQKGSPIHRNGHIVLTWISSNPALYQAQTLNRSPIIPSKDPPIRRNGNLGCRERLAATTVAPKEDFEELAEVIPGHCGMITQVAVKEFNTTYHTMDIS